MKTYLSALLAASLFASFATAQNAVPPAPEKPVTAARIRSAIDDAVIFLRNNMQPQGSFAGDSYGGGVSAMAVLAILAAGGDPKADEQLAGSLEWLAKLEPDNTYVRGLRANVWEYALRKMPYDDKLRERLKADRDWLVKAIGDREGWRYTMSSTDWDNSCTQYGVLGIWAAARAGLPPDDKLWLTLSKHFRGCQGEDGGWSYTTGGSTPNMATAGLASLFLVYDMYYARNVYRADQPKPPESDDALAVLRSIERGMDWLGKCQGGKTGSYYLYGIERTGVASGRKTIGGEDWFAEGVRSLLPSQGRGGDLGGRNDFHSGGVVSSTALSTLFLVYGGAPVAINKLQYGEGQDWNLNPRDIANLSKHLWNAYERPINWTSVPLSADVSEFDAPILFISGSKAVEFKDEDIAKLRAYILRGGTILAEPSDHQTDFTRAMESLAVRLFPRKPIPPASWNPFRPTTASSPCSSRAGPPPPGCAAFPTARVWCSSSPTNTSPPTGRPTRRTATPTSSPPTCCSIPPTSASSKAASPRSCRPPPRPSRADARPHRARDARRPGRLPSDWDAANQCWRKFAPVVTHLTGRKLDEAAPVKLGRDKLDDIRLLHITGRHSLKLDEAGRKALKEYVEAGGTVLVDAYARSPEFARSARAELEAVFGKLQPLASDSKLVEGGVDLESGVAFKLPARQLLRKQGGSPRPEARSGSAGHPTRRPVFRVRSRRSHGRHRELPLPRLQTNPPARSSATSWRSSSPD
ncbi:MAG: DUF4159 domain-containing protein [Kiritimatiellia bacterium]